ncbi:MAG: MFS transporter [Lachnospiraceae bacterium]|nr:MFS transporter [Lachnospiraceae bacterium]
MTKQKDRLYLFLFLIVFINGFEAGGYQASLYSIGQTYDLSVTNMGIFASVELLATMLAPLLLGNWADRTGKIKSMIILLSVQTAFSAAVFMSRLEPVFLIGIFFLGLTTSALQFIAIAALADSYPVSGKKKIGFLTSMYALGALVSPLVVSFYLDRGIDWRMLFLSITAGTLIAISGLFITRNEKREEAAISSEEEKNGRTFILAGVLFLCVVMCIYVGFENGFAFFVDTMFTDVLKSSLGKYALSLFWAVMIPSRILVGYLSKHAKKILLSSVIAIPVITCILSQLSSDIAVFLLCIPLGFACGAIYPSVLTTVLHFTGSRTATATGMITVSTGLGGVIFTALTGIMADALGMRGAMIALSSFFILSIGAVVATICLIRKKGL